MDQGAKAMSMTWKWALGLLLLVWPVLTKLIAPDVTYYDYMVSLVMIYVCIAIGLCILVGYTGLVSLGQAGFVAVGAYTAGMLTTKLQFDLIPALFIAACLCGILGFLLGLAAVRLKSTYLILVTIGFGFSIPHLLAIWKGFTGGHDGMVISSSTVFGWAVSGPKQYYYVVLVVTVFLIWLARNITKSKAGRAFQAVRDSEVAAQAMGVNILITRAVSFSISAVYAGIAGGLYAHHLGYISPSDYDIMVSLNYLIMVIVGGARSITGAAVGAFFFVLIMETFARAPAGLMAVFTGATIIITMLVLPRGLVSLPAALRSFWNGRKGGKRGTP
jgi:branched-chain amino acid transport system permease protein